MQTNLFLLWGVTPKSCAGVASIIGSAVAAIPHPFTKIVGSALTIPDLVFDVAKMKTDPTVGSAYHVGIDFPNQLGKIIPGKYDDAVLYALNALSVYDDLPIDSSSPRTEKQPPTSQISTTYVKQPIIVPTKKPLP